LWKSKIKWSPRAQAYSNSTLFNFSERLTQSNWGRCVDIYAPGERIWSAWNGDNDDGSFQTGTSSAAPYVAGAAALYLELNESMTPSDIKSALQNDASVGILKSKTDGGSLLPFKVRNETPNLLLNVGIFVSVSP
jgi:subtilisin family serine protease